MFGIGTPELVMILVLALVVLGPAKLPQLAKTIGKNLSSFRKTVDQVKREIDVKGLRQHIDEEIGLSEIKNSLDISEIRQRIQKAVVESDEQVYDKAPRATEAKSILPEKGTDQADSESEQ